MALRFLAGFGDDPSVSEESLLVSTLLGRLLFMHWYLVVPNVFTNRKNTADDAVPPVIYAVLADT